MPESLLVVVVLLFLLFLDSIDTVLAGTSETWHRACCRKFFSLVVTSACSCFTRTGSSKTRCTMARAIKNTHGLRCRGDEVKAAVVRDEKRKRSGSIRGAGRICNSSSVRHVPYPRRPFSLLVAASRSIHPAFPKDNDHNAGTQNRLGCGSSFAFPQPILFQAPLSAPGLLTAVFLVVAVVATCSSC